MIGLNKKRKQIISSVRKNKLFFIFCIVILISLNFNCKENKENKLIKMTVLYYPIASDFQGVDCEYVMSLSRSKETIITERSVLDSIQNMINCLKIENIDSSINVYSTMQCKLFYSDGKCKILHFGFFCGTCIDGIKIQDSYQLKRYIRTKIGFYKYFDKVILKYFDELNKN